MKLESELALEMARERRRTGPGRQETMLSGTAHKPRLTGIYGVGNRLFAEVRSGDRVYLFRNGMAMPVGRAASDSPFRLKEVAGACVRLQQQDDEMELCLSQGERR